MTAVDLPEVPFATRSGYLKVRDRASFAFALASAAVALDLQGGVIREARIALGGVGTKPWRARRAEAALIGGPATPDRFAAAAAEELSTAKVRRHNAFKVELAQRAIVRGLNRAMTGGTP